MDPFPSTTKAIERYVRLSQLLGTPRSIPLGIGKTHVSRSDTHERWENIRAELCILTSCMPSFSDSEAWIAVMLSLRTNLMPHERREEFEKITKRKISTYLFDRITSKAYLSIAKKLRERSLLEKSVPYLEI